MKILIYCVFFISLHSASAIYLQNDTKIYNEKNPAIWTEQGVWGPFLEEWALSGNNHRQTRVMKIPLSQNTLEIKEKADEKEGKISPGKVINTSGPKQPPQVSETDLYLLSAIEKLVFRVDYMEKRLRRVEEMLYYVTAGNRVDHDPCPDNFTRIRNTCYLFSGSAGREYDWKAASKQCKTHKGLLAEMETIEENQDVISYIQSSPYLKGKDFWTGGLNPGLLWIWSNSARPVSTHPSNSTGILGNGRCLRLSYDYSTKAYNYKGSDCSIRYSYICELPETSASNQIRRLGRTKQIFDEL